MPTGTDNDNNVLPPADIDQDEHADGRRDSLHRWITGQCRYQLVAPSTPLSEFRTEPTGPHQSSERDDDIRADSPLLGFGEEHEQSRKDDGGEVDNASRDPLRFPSPGYLPKYVVLAAKRDKPLPVIPPSSPPSSHHGHGHVSTHNVVVLPPSFTRLPYHPKPAPSRLSQQQQQPPAPQPHIHTRNPSSSSSGCSALSLAARTSPAISRRPSFAKQPSLQLLRKTSVLQADASPASMPTPLPTTSVISRSRSSASLASLFHLPTGFGLEVTSPSASSPAGPTVNIALSQAGGGYLRNAAYIDSDAVRERLELAASTSASGTTGHHGIAGGGGSNSKALGVFNKEKQGREKGEGDELIGRPFYSSKGHSGSPTEENVSSIAHLLPSHISNAPPTSNRGVPPNTPMMGYYTTPYASSSQVYLGTDALREGVHGSSHHLIPSSVALPLPTDTQARTRPAPAPLELALVSGESASPSPIVPSIILDTSSRSAPSSEEDHLASSPPPSASAAFFPVMNGREDIPLTSPAMSSFGSKQNYQGPYQGLGIPGDDGLRLSAAVDPTLSKWSVTSSTTDVEVGAAVSKDRNDKKKESDSNKVKKHKSPRLGTKRSRLASFLSILAPARHPELPLKRELGGTGGDEGIHDSVSTSAGTCLQSDTMLNASWEHKTGTVTRAGAGLGNASKPTLSLVTTPCASTPLSGAHEEQADNFRRLRSDMEMGGLAGEREHDVTITRSSASKSSSPLSSSSPTSPFGLAAHHHQHLQGDGTQLKAMDSIGSLSALAHQHGQQVGTAAAADPQAPHGKGSISRGFRGLAARFGLTSSSSPDSVSSSRTCSSNDSLTTTATNTISKRPSMDSKSIKSLETERKGPKWHLTVKGIKENDDGKVMHAVRAWCESFGELKKMERTKKGELVVDWRKASEAEKAYCLRDKVVIKGAEAVAMFWSNQKI